MKSWLRLHGTLATAVAIAVTLTTVFGHIAVQSLLGVLDPDRIDPNFARGSLFGSGGSVSNASGAAQNASALVALLLGAVVIVSVIIIGLIFRGNWTREAGMVIYGFLGLIAFATSLSGITADPPAPSAWLGLLTGLANFATVVLLLLPATARDFSLHLRLRAQAR
jgi:hypothetical protein